MRKITFLVLLLNLISLTSCKEKQANTPESQPQGFVSNDIVYDKPQDNPTYHVDEEHKYEYRTGTSGDYEYNYDVVGYDQDGNEVSGNISIQDKYGRGTITNSNGDEVEIDAEWVDYGKLKATDDDGNEYELEAE
jgi:hypothetical protein